MFNQFTSGDCPQCLLKGLHEAMMLNQDDFWECPKCQLQAHSASEGMLAIYRRRGKGAFSASRMKASDYVDGWVLTKDAGEEELRADSQGFDNEESLRLFLKEEIQK